MGSLLIVANWKMHKTLEEAKTFLKEFLPSISSSKTVEIVIAPPFTLLHPLKAIMETSGAFLGAQDCHWEKEGAFTGEVSPSMLVEAGCRYVILGHSERRRYFGETSAVIGEKFITSQKAGLLPILCVGENLEERNEGKTKEILETQLEGSMILLNKAPKQLIVAYEPIWAIGTGRVATIEQIKEAHSVIQEWSAQYWTGHVSCRVLYGGSVTPENVSEIMGDSSVQGVLVGGASLQSKDFSLLIERSLSAKSVS